MSEPIIYVPDLCAPERIPNLTPENLTEMIGRALENDDV